MLCKKLYVCMHVCVSFVQTPEDNLDGICSLLPETEIRPSPAELSYQHQKQTNHTLKGESDYSNI